MATNRSKFEYFLNAVPYCLWLRENKREYICGRIVETLLSPIPKLFFTKKYKKKYYEQYLPEANAKSDELFHDKKTGFNIGWAQRRFGYIYSFYPGFFSCILAAFGFKYFGYINYYVTLLWVAIPIILGYIPAYKAVFTNDRYLKYFKKFEKKDEAWHKKWKRRTTLFIIGGTTMVLLGIAAMFAILILIPDP